MPVTKDSVLHSPDKILKTNRLWWQEFKKIISCTTLKSVIKTDYQN